MPIAEEGLTKKLEPLARPNFHARLVVHLRAALEDAEEIPGGDDIADAIYKLLASAKRRELEACTAALPDITHIAEAA